MKKKKKTIEERRRSEKAGYQQGFSVEGAALLARPWLVPEPAKRFQDFTLASYITDKGYA